MHFGISPRVLETVLEEEMTNTYIFLFINDNITPGNQSAQIYLRRCQQELKYISAQNQSIL